MVNWPLIKEMAGFGGTVLILIPWLRDFHGRWQGDQIRRIRATGRLADLVRELVVQQEIWLGRAKFLDLALTVTGLAPVAMGFLIGVLLAV